MGNGVKQLSVNDRLLGKQGAHHLVVRACSIDSLSPEKETFRSLQLAEWQGEVMLIRFGGQGA
jgi:hypothetical protein